MVHHNGAMNAWTPEATNAFVARLESAERQIYPLAMVDTDRYERAVTLIGLLARHLDGSGDSAEDLELLRPKALTRLRGIASEQADAAAFEGKRFGTPHSFFIAVREPSAALSSRVQASKASWFTSISASISLMRFFSVASFTRASRSSSARLSSCVLC